MALDGFEWLASGPGRFTPLEMVAGTPERGSWVIPRFGLDLQKSELVAPADSNRVSAGVRSVAFVVIKNAVFFSVTTP